MNVEGIKQPIFEKWEIVEKIGEGAFGAVYKIKRESFGKTYYSALKVIKIPQNESEIKSLRNELGDDKGVSNYYTNFVQDFAKEIEVMSELKGNSNIVSFEDHDFIQNEDGIGWTILIRMELLTPFVDYQSKNELIFEEIVKLGIDICSALESCENKRIIHRDIKPENIFLSDDGRYELGDFGIARELEKTTGGLSKKGTYSYMAPEIYLGKPYNNTVDIYSLGIMLYKLLNHNRAPFLPEYPDPITFNDREKSLQSRMNGDEIPDIKDIPEELNNAVKMACAFDAKDRYQTANEMKEALIGVLNVEIPVVNESFTENETETIEKTVGPFGAADIPTDEKISENKESETTEKTVGPFGVADIPVDEKTSKNEKTAAEVVADVTVSPFNEDSALSENTDKSEATVGADITVTKKRQGVKVKAWQILSALLAVIIAITSVLVFKRNKPTVAVDDTSTGESQVEQLPEIIESISNNTQEENSDETENNEEDTAEPNGQTTENNEKNTAKADEQTKNNNVTNKSDNSVTTTKKNSGSGSNTSKSTTTTQAIGSNDNVIVNVASNYTWSLGDGVLTISPRKNGEKVAIKNYSSYYDVPWWFLGSDIKKVVIKDGIMNIPDVAFANCDSLTSVTIPNSVTSIGRIAFKECTKLTSITIPNSVTIIGEEAFGYCTGLKSVSIPNSVTTIDEGAFASTGLKSVTIPNSVTTIGKGAFADCPELTSVTIPNSVTTIDEGAFASTGLKSVTIPNSVTTIDDYAFRNCDKLTSVSIPNSVTTIGAWAFEGCSSLTNINYSGTKAQWRAISKGSQCFLYTGAYTVYCSDGTI